MNKKALRASGSPRKLIAERLAEQPTRILAAADSWVESKDPVDVNWLQQNIPCQAACPIRTDIPGYIEAILKGDYKTAYRINRRDNIFPGVLGRVCHRPCEPVCRHSRPGLGDAVQICFLKRSASDFGSESFLQPAQPNGKKVCVIGAGPSGLTAANDLALLGYRVTVLEQYDEPGGMMRYGIPAFRLPPEVVAKDVASIRELGVEIKTGVRFESRKELETLEREYDAVILASGCMMATRMDIPGMDAQGFYWGLDFMMEANQGRLNIKPEKVVVIGGGFTAVDCARTAYRLGARKITLAYRRTEALLRVGRQEVEALKHEGIAAEFMASPIVVEQRGNRVTGLTLVRNELNKDGKATPIAGSTFTLEADTVILAIGQSAEELSAAPTTAKLGRKRGNRFYLAGDFRNGSGTVIEACADGRETARAVHRELTGEDVEEVVDIQPVNIQDLPRWREHDFVSPEKMSERPLDDRLATGREVEQGFNRVQALVESHRCYLCHYNFQIDVDRCIYCMKCLDVMPVDCIHLVKDIVEEPNGYLRYVPAANWTETEAIAIDNDLCIRCGNCVRACPVNCISVSKYTRRFCKITLPSHQKEGALS